MARDNVNLLLLGSKDILHGGLVLERLPRVDYHPNFRRLGVAFAFAEDDKDDEDEDEDIRPLGSTSHSACLS
jgi:hypothetical protein